MTLTAVLLTTCCDALKGCATVPRVRCQNTRSPSRTTQKAGMQACDRMSPPASLPWAQTPGLHLLRAPRRSRPHVVNYSMQPLTPCCMHTSSASLSGSRPWSQAVDKQDQNTSATVQPGFARHTRQKRMERKTMCQPQPPSWLHSSSCTDTHSLSSHCPVRSLLW